jgi:hypothetical protein
MLTTVTLSSSLGFQSLATAASVPTSISIDLIVAQQGDAADSVTAAMNAWVAA